MSHLFISYSREDYEAVQRLITDLQAHNLPIYIDQVGLKPGTFDWEQALRDAIRDARAVILVASPSSRRSQYVRDEIAIARMQDKPIYPAWVAGDEWMESVPMGLGHVQFVDVRDESYSTGLEKLAASLKTDEVLRTDEIPLPPIPDAPPRNPYKGLRPFRVADQHDFFGREALIQELIEAVNPQSNKPRFLAVVGPSGSGKSSVVMAGLLPALQGGTISSSDQWLYLDPLVPGRHPLESLAVTLAKAMPEKSQQVILDDLNAPSKRGLHMLGRQIAPVDAHVLIYVDQFEELYTLTVDRNERQQFTDLLTTAASEPDGPIIIIISLRADFYHQPMSDTALGILIETCSKSILPLSLADLYEVVQRPAELPDVHVTFDEGLVTELVFTVREQPGALPLLQFTLDQLFANRQDRHLTRTAYEELGGVHGALANHAEGTFEHLPTSEHRRLTRALFLRLIEPGDSEQNTTRRRTTMTELTLPDPEQTRIMQESAQAFIDARLLVSDRNQDTTTLEVSHEALLREWERLKNWLFEARDDIRRQTAIANIVNEWIEGGRQSDDDRLFRGSVLDDALQWSTRNVPSADEAAFIKLSVDAQERQQERDAAIARRVKNFERASMVLALMIVVAIAVAIWASATSINARDEVNVANETLAAVNEQVDLQEDRSRSLSLASDAELAFDRGDKELALILALAANEIDNPPITAQRTLAEIGYSPDLLNIPDIEVRDRNILATFLPNSHHLVLSPDERSLMFLDTDSGVITNEISLEVSEINSIKASLDASYLVVGALLEDGTGQAFLIEVSTGNVLHEFEDFSRSPIVELSPDGTILATYSDNMVMLWNVNSGDLSNEIVSDGLSELMFDKTGSLLYGLARDQITAWRLDTGEVDASVERYPDFDWIAPNGEYELVLTGQTGRSIYTMAAIDLETDEELWRALDLDFYPDEVLFSHDGNYAMIIRCMAMDNCGTYVADLVHGTNGEIVGTFQFTVGFMSRVRALSSDAQRLALTRCTGGLGSQPEFCTLMIYDTDGSIFTSQVRHNGPGYDAVIRSDGNTLISAGCRRINDSRFDDCLGEVIVQDLLTRSSQRFLEHDGPITGVTLVSETDRLVTGSEFGQILIWDMSDWSIEREIDTGASIQKVAMIGQSIAALHCEDPVPFQHFCQGGWIIGYDLETGEVTFTLQNPETRFIDMVHSSNEHSMIVIECLEESCLINQYNLETGEILQNYDIQDSSPLSLASTMDGTRFASSNRGGTIILWNVETGDRIKTLSSHSDTATTLQFSPTGDMLVSGACSDRGPVSECIRAEVVVWDIESEERLYLFEALADRPLAVHFGSDGKTVFASGCSQKIGQFNADYCGRGGVVIWRVLSLDELIQWVNDNRIIREPTCVERQQYALEPLCTVAETE